MWGLWLVGKNRSNRERERERIGLACLASSQSSALALVVLWICLAFFTFLFFVNGILEEQEWGPRATGVAVTGRNICEHYCSRPLISSKLLFFIWVSGNYKLSNSATIFFYPKFNTSHLTLQIYFILKFIILPEMGNG